MPSVSGAQTSQGFPGCKVVEAWRHWAGRQAGRPSSYDANGGHWSGLSDVPLLGDLMSPYFCDNGFLALSTRDVTLPAGIVPQADIRGAPREVLSIHGPSRKDSLPYPTGTGMLGHTSSTLDHSPAETGSKKPHISGIVGSMGPAAFCSPVPGSHGLRCP